MLISTAWKKDGNSSSWNQSKTYRSKTKQEGSWYALKNPILLKYRLLKVQGTGKMRLCREKQTLTYPYQLNNWAKPQFSQFSSVAQSCPTLFNPMNRSTPGLPVRSPTPRVYPSPCPLSRWCHLTISFSAVPFSSRPQSFPASGTFPISQLFTSGDQSIVISASASVLPMNTQDWYALGWTGWISLS